MALFFRTGAAYQTGKLLWGAVLIALWMRGVEWEFLVWLTLGVVALWLWRRRVIVAKDEVSDANAVPRLLLLPAAIPLAVGLWAWNAGEKSEVVLATIVVSEGILAAIWVSVASGRIQSNLGVVTRDRSPIAYYSVLGASWIIFLFIATIPCWSRFARFDGKLIFPQHEHSSRK